jgi:SAM-dependent methyltransferase
MENKKQILLPGLAKQLSFLEKNLNTEPKSILVMGASSEMPALELANVYNVKIELIVEEYESLLNSKLVLKNDESINLKMMSFENTDYRDNEFDLIYAQASISLVNRNKIIKEIKRILKPGGFLCVGEIVSFTKEPPRFIQDIFDSSSMLPLYHEDIQKYYLDRKFVIVAQENLSSTLKEFYSINAAKLDDAVYNLTDNEKSYYKKIVNKISHESNVYLKLGGDKHFGFRVLLLRKG